MPLWLQLLSVSTPAALALIAVVWRMGVLHNEVKNIATMIEPIPKMAEDIAYLKGIDDGKRQAAVVALTEHLTPSQRRKVSAAL
jgi:hypothetical protein